MREVNKRKALSATKSIAIVGMIAASMECAKILLAAVPNVEAVSLLIALYSYSFGYAGVIGAFVFVCIEPLVWGMGTWFVSYLIYWPLLSVVFFILGRVKIKNRFALTGIAVVMTFFFGILTSLVDIGLFSGSFDNFFYRFGIYYARGVFFYAMHIGSNFAIFLFVFPPLLRFMTKLKNKIFK